MDNYGAVQQQYLDGLTLYATWAHALSMGCLNPKAYHVGLTTRALLSTV